MLKKEELEMKKEHLKIKERRNRNKKITFENKIRRPRAWKKIVCCRCWDKDPNSRPSMTEVAELVPILRGSDEPIVYPSPSGEIARLLHHFCMLLFYFPYLFMQLFSAFHVDFHCFGFRPNALLEKITFALREDNALRKNGYPDFAPPQTPR